MHAAKVASSPRLRRVLDVLSDHREHTTLEIAERGRTVAVSACVSELRANGHAIACRQEKRPEGRVWLYRLDPPPPTPLELAAGVA